MANKKNSIELNGLQKLNSVSKEMAKLHPKLKNKFFLKFHSNFDLILCSRDKQNSVVNHSLLNAIQASKETEISILVNQKKKINKDLIERDWLAIELQINFKSFKSGFFSKFWESVPSLSAFFICLISLRSHLYRRSSIRKSGRLFLNVAWQLYRRFDVAQKSNYNLDTNYSFGYHNNRHSYDWITSFLNLMSKFSFENIGTRAVS